MGSGEQDHIASDDSGLRAGEAQQVSTPKDATAVSAKDATVKVSEDGLPDDAPKTYYSKLSIWLMILYSGLAIGSDG